MDYAINRGEVGMLSERKGIMVIVENHNGVGSEHPEDLIGLAKLVGANIGVLPDFGNFPGEDTREKGALHAFPFRAHGLPRQGA